MSNTTTIKNESIGAAESRKLKIALLVIATGAQFKTIYCGQFKRFFHQTNAEAMKREQETKTGRDREWIYTHLL